MEDVLSVPLSSLRFSLQKELLVLYSLLVLSLGIMDFSGNIPIPLEGVRTAVSGAVYLFGLLLLLSSVVAVLHFVVSDGGARD